MSGSKLLMNHVRADARAHLVVARIADEDPTQIKVCTVNGNAVCTFADIACGPFVWVAHENAIGGWDQNGKEVTIRILDDHIMERNGKRTGLEIYIPYKSPT